MFKRKVGASLHQSSIYIQKIIAYYFSKQMTTDIIVKALKSSYVLTPKEYERIALQDI